MSTTVSSLNVRRESPDQPDVLALLTALDQHLHDAQDADVTHYILSPDSLMQPDIDFFVARDAAGNALGCGALRRDHDYAELKRMYCTPAVRGLGVGKRIIETLLDTARSHGYRSVRLETGVDLTEAVTLYRRFGFVQIPAFGEYAATPDTSYCMEAHINA